MGLIRDWVNEMGGMWGRMGQGEAGAFIGLPKPQQGTGHAGGTGHVPPQPPNALTEKQRQMLNRFFHQQYGRYPISEYEFQQWLRDNW